MTGRCATCKHWRETFMRDDQERPCAKSDDDRPSLMRAIDTGGYGGVVYTKAEYGCVMWEGKDG